MAKIMERAMSREDAQKIVDTLNKRGPLGYNNIKLFDKLQFGGWFTNEISGQDNWVELDTEDVEEDEEEEGEDEED